jgi:hypothetical protein
MKPWRLLFVTMHALLDDFVFDILTPFEKVVDYFCRLALLSPTGLNNYRLEGALSHLDLLLGNHFGAEMDWYICLSFL